MGCRDREAADVGVVSTRVRACLRCGGEVIQEGRVAVTAGQYVSEPLLGNQQFWVYVYTRSVGLSQMGHKQLS